MNTEDIIKQFPIPEADRDWLMGAIATRGKYRGNLKAKASGTAAEKAAWQCLVGFLAPARVNAYALMMMDEATAGTYRRIDAELMRTNTIVPFLLNAGEPGLRWNLWSTRYDAAKVEAIIPQLLQAWKDKLQEAA